MLLTSINLTLFTSFLAIIILCPEALRVKFVANNKFNSSLQIQLPNGTIQGTERVTNESKVPYLAFQGIPFARTPVGHLRFRSPQWFPKWNGVLDATNERSSCIQMIVKGHKFGSENCLFLNVYTPKLSIVKYFGVKLPNLLAKPVTEIRPAFEKMKNVTQLLKKGKDKDPSKSTTENGLVEKIASNINHVKKSSNINNSTISFTMDHEIKDTLKNTKNKIKNFEDKETKQKKSFKLEDGKKLAVMVFIHGGAFIDGFSNMSVYGPDYLLENNVVFVSMNYRVGIFGFFSTDDLECPGNFGLKDIIQALSWIKINVAFFGGDPDKVTIFGQSAGAACVSYIIQAPQAQGLFSAAIMQSGSALCPWSLNLNPKATTRLVGLRVGLIGANSSTLLDKLRSVEADNLNSIAWAVLLKGVGYYEKIIIRRYRGVQKSAMEPINGLAIGPVIEPNHPDAVITGHMHERFKSGAFKHVPIIMGFTSQEASVLQNYINLGRPIFAHWDLKPSLLVPINMNLKNNNTDRKTVGHLIKNFYFGEKYIATSSTMDILNYISDSQFVRSIRENAKLCAQSTRVYLYQFSYQGLLGKLGTPMLQDTTQTTLGAGHVEDLWYIFKKENLTAQDHNDTMIRDRMVKLWTNFAKFTDPTPTLNEFSLRWPQVNEGKNDSVRYLNIDSKMDIRYNPHDEAMKFWDELYGTYGHPPYDNY